MKLTTSLLLFCIVFMLAHCQRNSFFRRKTLRFDKFDGKCPKYKNVPMYVDHIRMQNFNRTIYVSMKIHMDKYVDFPLKMSFLLKRCAHKADPNSCEDTSPIKIRKFCEFLQGDGKPWSEFMKLMKPPIGNCPWQKGIYEVTNGTFDGSKFGYLPLDGWYWKVTTELANDNTNEIIMCLYAEGQITPV